MICHKRTVLLANINTIQVLLAAGDTFRAAASEQLEIWAERTGSEIVVAEGEKAKAPSGMTFIYTKILYVKIFKNSLLA